MNTSIDTLRLHAAKRSFAVRNVPLTDLHTIDGTPLAPRAGDVVLARVMEVGRLARIELPTGRKSTLYEGDEVVLCFGRRYAPDAYEAELVKDLGPCELAAAGGLAARIVETNAKFADEDRPPTILQPIGVFKRRDGRVVNVADYALPASPRQHQRPRVITVFGASMNAGKTTTAAGLVRGLAANGMRVGAAKVTGTCSGGDLWKFIDAGAHAAIDFTDAGFATTYKESVAAIAAGADRLVASLAARGCDVIVVEIADGLFQKETRDLLCVPTFRSMTDHWVFAADSAPSILVGHKMTEDLGLELAGMSGSVTASPLAMREAGHHVSTPMLTLPELQDGTVTCSWLDIDPALSRAPVVGALERPRAAAV